MRIGNLNYKTMRPYFLLLLLVITLPTVSNAQSTASASGFAQGHSSAIAVGAGGSKIQITGGARPHPNEWLRERRRHEIELDEVDLRVIGEVAIGPIVSDYNDTLQ